LECNIGELDGYENFANYTIFSDGTILNNRTHKKVSQRVCKKNGYLMVSLWNANCRRQCTVHRLLALAFVENPQLLAEVNHKDGDKLNNSLDNLEWISHRENIKHAVDMGLHNPRFSKRADVRKRVVCCNDGRIFKSVVDAGRCYGIKSIGNISSVLNGHRKSVNGLRFEYYG
jgi:hypothetical protein